MIDFCINLDKLCIKKSFNNVFQYVGHECQVFGDPHIVTFDSDKYYNMNSKCNFTLVQRLPYDPDFSNPDEPEYAIYGTFVQDINGTKIDKIYFKDNENTILTLDINYPYQVMVCFFSTFY